MSKLYVRPEEVAARKGIKLALGCSAADDIKCWPQSVAG